MKFTPAQTEAEVLRLKEEIRGQYSLSVPTRKSGINITVAQTPQGFIAVVEAPGWEEDTAKGGTEIQALRKLLRKLGGEV